MSKAHIIEELLEDIIAAMEGYMDYDETLEFLKQKYSVTLLPLIYSDGNGY